MSAWGRNLGRGGEREWGRKGRRVGERESGEGGLDRKYPVNFTVGENHLGRLRQSPIPYA